MLLDTVFAGGLWVGFAVDGAEVDFDATSVDEPVDG